LSRWLQRSYLRAAILPLVIIELGFLAIYWISGNITYRRNVEAVAEVSRAYISDIASREAATVESTLTGVTQMTALLARSTRRVLDTPYDPPSSEKARYGPGPGGSFVTKRGVAGRDAAAFFSGATPIGPAQVDKVWRSVALDPTLRDIAESSPLVQQVYINTFDSYNRIYPYFNVLEQYAPAMRIPDYNFYYEADAKHNPRRKPVWTDAYVDPAGSGWMVSSIAPVYGDDDLQAVVGIDLTVDSVIKHVLDIRLPWNGYAMLIGRDGTILALPAAGEKDLNLRELKGHRYDDAIRSDTFKPDTFNVNRRPDLRPLATLLKSKARKVARLELGGRGMIVASAPMPETGWSLAVLVPESEILAEANALRTKFQITGAIMAAVLLVFYLAFFSMLVRRSRAMSRRVAKPLEEVEAIMARIGAGEYRQQAPHSGIREIDLVSESLVTMGGNLGDAYSRIVAQEETIRHALESEQRVTSGQRRFITVMSHELRTPLTIIDGCGQVLKRRAGRLTEEALVERAGLIRDSAQRIQLIVDRATDFASNEEKPVEPRRRATTLGRIAEDAVMSVEDEHERIRVYVPDPEHVVEVDGTLIVRAVAAVLDNALKYAAPGSPVDLGVTFDGEGCTFTVTDNGPGIPEADVANVKERFYRGSNSTAVPGAGVGLFLAEQWIAAQGGTLSVRNEPDQGARVQLTVPVTTPDGNAPEEASPAAAVVGAAAGNHCISETNNRPDTLAKLDGLKA
jgi:signal transduction histidine kinase